MRSGGGGGALGVVGGGGLPRLRRSARLLRAAAAAAAAGEEEGGAAGGVAAGGNGRRGGVGGAGGAAEETAAGAEPRRRGGKRKNEEEGQKAAPSATKRISRQKTAKGESSGGRQETGKITTTSAKKKSGKGAKAPSNGPSRDKEERLVAGGRATHVVGTDEAGRGPLAGPVVAAAAWLPPGDMIPGITDSKMVSKEEQREELYKILINKPGVVWATHITDAKRIDEINILNASLESMRFAAEEVVARLQQEQAGGGRGGRGGGGGGGCTVAPYILVDGNRLPKEMRHDGEAVVKGDASQYCIAAASIIAKVTRDRIMAKYHERWPEYGFLQHKGYPTKAHMAAISKNGPCEIHRMTFRPLKTEDAETNKK